MNDIRILMPWDGWPEAEKRFFDQESGQETYDYFATRVTRPITPEDIRSCLRMPDEWTPDEEKEYEESFYKKDGYNIWQVNESLDVAGKALDIATRPAPVEHKPCPFCGGTANIRPDSAGKEFTVECICGVETPWHFTEAEAWAAWDRRTTDETP